LAQKAAEAAFFHDAQPLIPDETGPENLDTQLHDLPVSQDYP
jgi:hypothetical protein